jgi:hypothetical protein
MTDRTLRKNSLHERILTAGSFGSLDDLAAILDLMADRLSIDIHHVINEKPFLVLARAFPDLGITESQLNALQDFGLVSIQTSPFAVGVQIAGRMSPNSFCRSMEFGLTDKGKGLLASIIRSSV